MNSADYEFIREVPSEKETHQPIELTGWETIVFEVQDDEPIPQPLDLERPLPRSV